MDVLKNFSQIVIENPVDKIIRQIRDLITSGQLKAGDRLPSERKLSEKLGVGRTHLRDALKKLEFYGILKTLPQSGTVVAGIGIVALEGLLTDLLNLEDADIKSLVETRLILETQSVKLAAERRTKQDIIEIENALIAHKEKLKVADYAVEEDLLFHIRIAEASKNAVLKSLMMIITPDILAYFNKNNVCGEGRSIMAVQHHEMILEHIKNQDEEGAVEAIREHLRDVVEFVNSPINTTSQNGLKRT